MLEFIPEVLRPYLNSILIGVAGIAIAIFAARILGRVLQKPMGKGWSKFVANLVGYGIGIWTLQIILESAGAAGVIVVVITALTVAFALGSERYAGDFVSGLSLFILKGFDVDDHVQLAGIDGKVSSISLMMTVLENEQGDRFFIRNSDATGGLIVTYKAQTSSPISVKLALPIMQDLSLAVSAIDKAIQGFSMPELENAPQPVVVVETAADGYAIIEVCTSISTQLDEGAEKTRLFMLAFNALKSAGLKL